MGLNTPAEFALAFAEHTNKGIDLIENASRTVVPRPRSDDKLDAISALHQPADDDDTCCRCGNPHPCATRRILDA